MVREDTLRLPMAHGLPEFAGTSTLRVSNEGIDVDRRQDEHREQPFAP